jgi:hypothetical protein
MRPFLERPGHISPHRTCSWGHRGHGPRPTSALRRLLLAGARDGLWPCSQEALYGWMYERAANCVRHLAPGSTVRQPVAKETHGSVGHQGPPLVGSCNNDTYPSRVARLFYPRMASMRAQMVKWGPRCAGRWKLRPTPQTRLPQRSRRGVVVRYAPSRPTVSRPNKRTLAPQGTPPCRHGGAQCGAALLLARTRDQRCGVTSHTQPLAWQGRCILAHGSRWPVRTGAAFRAMSDRGLTEPVSVHG